MGRKPGQAGAPAALRAAGLEAAVSSHEVVSQPDLILPEARAERAFREGLLNETALVKMVTAQIRPSAFRRISVTQWEFNEI